MSAKTYTPIAPRASYFTEDPHATLTDAQQAMYNEVLAHFTKDGYLLPNVDKGDLTEKEKFWLSRECFLRYLRASKWKVTTAIERVENTLKWRREYGLYDLITQDYVEPEAVTGKEILFGFDTSGRPAFYMNPSRQNTTDPVRQNQFAVWMLERGIDLMESGVETVDLLIDFAQRAKHPNFTQARDFLYILQDHYPERLGLALLLNVPFLVNAFLKLIMPFVDPNTRVKVKPNPNVINDKIFEADQVMTGWGGAHDFEYVHETYWPELFKKTQANVTKWTAKWRELGGTIGISEWAYKGGVGEAGEEVEPTELADDSEDKTTEKGAAVAAVTTTLAATTLVAAEETKQPEPAAAVDIETKKEEQKEVKAVPAVIDEPIQPAAASSGPVVEDEKSGKVAASKQEVPTQGAPAGATGVSGESSGGGAGAISAGGGGESGGGSGGGDGGGE